MGGELPLPLAWASPQPDQTEAICACWREVYGTSCGAAYGAPDPACLRRYTRDCRRLLECIRRDPASPPVHTEE
jgi:hypothetical protein